ncbi:LPS assembly lipoprotein LptE [Methylobacillus gramineus]|uniref:LPS-assembly lipoprotein LptE n=1 Tax=Methylobacillus gramineus TaxID=755169 RepID=UPI001D000843|nr:LPS assembly lipoprotein LptE [Methylobacillus gramineus]MCB5186315.1 LPS assembly lipoprotein LptE [Methylobacillus gramineus]
MHMRATRLILIALLLALTACGFKMRGIADLKFNTLYIQGPTISISKPFKRQVAVNGVKIVSSADQADLLLEIMSEAQEQRILSLSGRGLVREYELFYTVNFRLRDPSSETWGDVQSIKGRREITYDDSQLLAKQLEQERLYNDMKDDAVRELLRRLVVQRPDKSKPRAADLKTLDDDTVE